MDHATAANIFEIAFLTLQAINVAFLFFHDWIPLGRLNNLAAMRGQDSLGHRVYVTLLGGLPAALGLFFSLRHFGRPYPHDVTLYLWVMYGIFALGLLRAWWIPYLLIPDAERAARYKVIFNNTHTVLPVRNGLAPDTLHTVFHLNLFATMVLLFLRSHVLTIAHA